MTRKMTTAFSTRTATPQVVATLVLLDQKIATKDTVVCKDRILGLFWNTSCVSPILQEMTRKSQRRSQRQSQRQSRRRSQTQASERMEVGDCLVFQYVYNWMFAPFQHQVANSTTCVITNTLHSKRSKVSRVAYSIALKTFQLASSTPCRMVIARFTKTVITLSHVRLVRLGNI